MKLPNPDRAVIPPEKLEGYALNPDHPEGRHKAVVFRSALGIAIAEAEALRAALRQALQNREAIATQRNAHGQKYQVDFNMSTTGKSVMIRSA